MTARASTPKGTGASIFNRRQLLFVLTIVITLLALPILSPRLVYALSHITINDAYVNAHPAVVSTRVPGVVQVYSIRDGVYADVFIGAVRGVCFHGPIQASGGPAQSSSGSPGTQITATFVKITQRIPVRILIEAASISGSSMLHAGMSAEVSVTDLR